MSAIRAFAFLLSTLFGLWGSGQAACPERIGRDIPASKDARTAISIDEVVALNDEIDTSSYDIRALLIVRHCQLAFERYKRETTRETRHAAYSVTKSIVSTTAGVAIHQGLLASPSVHLGTLLSRPDSLSQEDWSRVKGRSLADFMGMRSGLQYQHNPSNHPIYRTSIDRVAVALSAPDAAKPGARFNYSDGDASVSGAMVAAAFGKNLRDAVNSSLWRPLDAQPLDWFGEDAAGRYPGGWATHARPMDLAKLGLLYLQHGKWNGQSLITPEYAAAAWAPGPSPRYGLGWWISEVARYGFKVYWANGFKGQRIYIVPELDLVVVVMASLSDEEVAAIYPKLVRRVIDAARGGGQQASPEMLSRFHSYGRTGFNGHPTVPQSAQDMPKQ